MADITQIPPGIERRRCPGCGFIKSQKLIDAARFDFDCPRCGKHKLSEFVPEIDPTPLKPGKRRAATISVVLSFIASQIPLGFIE
jgi:hypothetical protein